MIQNPAMSGGGENKKYKIDDSELVAMNSRYALFPKEAEPGSFVTTYSGVRPGSAIPVKSKDGGYIISYATIVNSISELPPKVQEIVQQAPQTYAPPVSDAGYAFFIMPHEDVKALSY